MCIILDVGHCNAGYGGEKERSGDQYLLCCWSHSDTIVVCLFCLQGKLVKSDF